MRLLGNLLIGVSLVGLLAVGLIAADVTPPWARPRPVSVAAERTAGDAPRAIAAPTEPPQPPAASPTAPPATPTRPSATPSPPPASPTAASASATAAPKSPTPPPVTPTATAVPSPVPAPIRPTEEPRRPIERIAIPRVGLDAPVVPAHLVERGGALTWEIPAFKVGHADGTAGAGGQGNAVLLGHVDSVHSGDVFRDLEKVMAGDAVTVWSGGIAFTYRVVWTGVVERTDTGMVGTTETPSLTLFTCTGLWSPALWDYTERFVVRAKLREITGG